MKYFSDISHSQDITCVPDNAPHVSDTAPRSQDITPHVSDTPPCSQDTTCEGGTRAMLSVIIVAYRSGGHLFQCLDSLFSHADIPSERLEVIVVDNDSPDGPEVYPRVARLYGNRVRIVRNSRNGGYGQGNNVGIAAATAPVIMIMNPDVRLCMPVMGEALSVFASDKSAGIVGMTQMLSATRRSTNSFCCTNAMNGYLSVFLTALCNRLSLFLPWCMHLSGACFFIRKDAFERASLFDERLFMYAEEDDISRRMRRLGMRLVYMPRLAYIHLTEQRAFSLKAEQRVVESIVYVNEKHGTPPSRTYLNELRKVRVMLLRQRLRNLIGLPAPLLDDYVSFAQWLKQRI